jgi:putative DNA primase/helicase
VTNKVAFERERNEAFHMKLRVSEGWHNLGKVVNKTVRWPKLCERFGVAAVDNITMDEYRRLGQAARHSRKNFGWFVGGTFKDGVRRNATIECRSLLAFDIDDCSPELYEMLMAGTHPVLRKYEYLVHTTRSHTPEAPRIRLTLPLKREITPGEFGPISRILGFHIDESMKQIDPVSFRITQLMFLPSVSSDGVFDWNWHQGKLLDPEVVLRLWERDYGRDYARLPRSPRETGKLREHGQKVGDPRKKRGVIGAWCRAHSITELLDGAWSHLYQPGEATVDGTLRYSYVPGSTSNGVLVYEDLWAYSHHSSDPISSTLVNAWDLERILRFGHLDKHNEEDEWGDHDPRKLPSYKAMLEHVKDDTATQWELAQTAYDQEAIADDLPVEDDAPEPEGAPEPAPEADPAEPPPAAAPDIEWQKQLDRTGEGILKSTLFNVAVILEHDHRFKSALAYNGFLEQHSLMRQIGSRRLQVKTRDVREPTGVLLQDADLDTIRCILEAPRGEGKSGWGLRVSDRDMKAAVNIVAARHAFHPVRDFLDACEWDGEPRLSKLLHTYWHVDQNEYHSQVGALFMTAAVARIYEPGHKFDNVVIFEGPQRRGKSSAIRALAGDGNTWFGEFPTHLKGPREVVEHLQGRWLVEFPELATLLEDRHTAEMTKAFFSAQSDRARMAYGRNATDYPRQNIPFGTTNQHEYLRDVTGDTRYLSIVVPDRMIDVPGIRRDRVQLWAEARERYQFMRRQPQHRDHAIPLPLFLTGEANEAALALQSTKRQSSDRDRQRGR